MSETEFNAELREYQWRRKFERGPRRTFPAFILPMLILLAALMVAAHSVVNQ